MLTSTVIRLSPVIPGPCPAPLGVAAQAWFLGQIAARDPRRSVELHDASLPPYTVSALMDDSWHPVRPNTALSAKNPVYLRITTLAPWLSELWQSNILPALPKGLVLDGFAFEVIGYSETAAQHAWADQRTFGDIYHQAESDRHLKISMDFASPTAFRSDDGSDVPLPFPGPLLRSWARRWNAFAPAPLQISPDDLEKLDRRLKIVNLAHIHSIRWNFNRGQQAAIGFVGQVDFSLRHTQLQAGEKANLLQVLHSLSHFALYCGSGHHTARGMGQTRRLEQQSAEEL